MALIVAYGAGTNSTAMLIKMWKRGTIPDLIIFADTGGERPETYWYIIMFSLWLVAHGMPPITVVKVTSRTLEEDCLIRKALPALAYGFKTCSLRFKAEPQDKYINHFPLAIEAWEKGEKVIKAIGYDYGEERRMRNSQDKKYQNWFPLIEWEIDRDACIKTIADAGLPQPGKSSCFFCPSMKKTEIFELRQSHPDLLKRALVMESNAELTVIPGLGRSYSWNGLIHDDENQIKMFVDVVDQECNCYDG
ncbi:MAG TPA: phosphoadenosine phosphosulfate reductase [Desulfosporosinus sp.]|nr:phosphoadenosine phosphosulfate reductase [Desulfosporosinus sp.]